MGRAGRCRSPNCGTQRAHGALGVAVLAAPTLGGGLDVLSRFSHVRAPFFRLKLVTRGQLLHLTYELTADLDEEQWQPMIEISFSSIRALCRAVLGREPEEAQFRFACAEPRHAVLLRAALGEALVFRAQVNAIVIPKSWATHPSAFADAALFRGALTELAATLDHLESPRDLKARVERLLHTMPDGRLDADEVARALGVSTRTLSRRLKAAGAQFRDLLDTEMKRRAERLRAEGLSRDAMAERLGYRDPTSFSRACRRWFAD